MIRRAVFLFALFAAGCPVPPPRWACAVELDASGRPKPTLVIYTSSALRCVRCGEFRRDLDDPAFRAALFARYSIQMFDADAYAWRARTAGVKELPAFIGPNLRYEGYAGKEDLARRLGLAWSPPAEPLPPAPPAIDTLEALPRAAVPQEPPRPTAREELGSELAQIVEHIRQLESVQANDKTPAVLEDHARRLKALYDQLERLGALYAQLAEPPAAATATPADQAAQQAQSGGFFRSLLGGAWNVGKAFVVGGPAAAAVAGGVWLVRRRLRRRAADAAPVAAAPAPASEGVAGDSVAEGLDALRLEITRLRGLIAAREAEATIAPTVFTPFETRTYAEAVAWAKDQLVRRYPGAVGTVQTLDGLVEQYLSSYRRAA